jgi:hypothetical protein
VGSSFCFPKFTSSKENGFVRSIAEHKYNRKNSKRRIFADAEHRQNSQSTHSRILRRWVRGGLLTEQLEGRDVISFAR